MTVCVAMKWCRRWISSSTKHMKHITTKDCTQTEIDPKRSEILLTHSQIELVYTEEREIEMVEMETDQHLTNSHKYKTNSISFQYANWSKRSSDSVFIRQQMMLIFFNLNDGMKELDGNDRYSFWCFIFGGRLRFFVQHSNIIDAIT